MNNVQQILQDEITTQGAESPTARHTGLISLWQLACHNTRPFPSLGTSRACKVRRPLWTANVVSISQLHCIKLSQAGIASWNNLKETDKISLCSKHSMFPRFRSCFHGSASINLVLAEQKSMWQSNELSLSTHHSFSGETQRAGILSAVHLLVQSAALANRTQNRISAQFWH